MVRLLTVVGGYGGGLKTYIDNLSTHLVQYDSVDSISIVTFEQPGNTPLLQDNKISYEIINTSHFDNIYVRNLEPKTILLGRKKIKELIEEKHIDVIHVHTHNIPLADIAAFAAVSKNIPLVITYHGGDKRTMRAHISLNTFGVFPKCVADKKLVVSNAAKEILGSDAEVIGVPIHERFYSEQFKDHYFSQYGLGDEKIIFYPARIDSKKGQMDIVLADHKLLNVFCSSQNYFCRRH